MSHKRRHSPGLSTNPFPSISPSEIHTSHAIHDRGSKFIALFSTADTHKSQPKLLQQHVSLSGCMHRVLAWRKASTQTTLNPARRVFETASDEDGETYAGKHVEKVLSQCDVEGVCVVGRWFGGTLLGPVRFEHIEKCAREAVEIWRASSSSSGSSGNSGSNSKTLDAGMAKKAKMELPAEAHSREELTRVLLERDESVRVLRALLVEKQLMLGGLQGATKDQSPVRAVSSPAKVVAYDGMSVAQLRGQEKARDATLTWILKQIEGVEREIEEIVELPEDVDGDDDGDADVEADIATKANAKAEADGETETKKNHEKEATLESKETPLPELTSEAKDES